MLIQSVTAFLRWQGRLSSLRTRPPQSSPYKGIGAEEVSRRRLGTMLQRPRVKKMFDERYRITEAVVRELES